MDEKLGTALPIYLAGHSLGGALAVLAAAKLCADAGDTWEQRIKGVITFGQPGMGDHAFRKHYPLHDKTHRLCVGIDIVTFLPPFVTYRHIGHQYWLHHHHERFNNSWMERLNPGLGQLDPGLQGRPQHRQVRPRAGADPAGDPDQRSPNGALPSNA